MSAADAASTFAVSSPSRDAIFSSALAIRISAADLSSASSRIRSALVSPHDQASFIDLFSRDMSSSLSDSICSRPSSTSSAVNKKLVELRESGGVLAQGRVLTPLESLRS